MTSRLTWDGNNIDILLAERGLERSPEQKFTQNLSATGYIEQVNFFGSEKVSIDTYFTVTEYRSLYAWFWSWAREGNVSSFALDSADTVDTTLDGSTSGATVPLTSTTGIAIGDECLIIADGDDAREIIIVDSISAGVSVTADANLINTFASGDVFRHMDYYPSLILADKSFNPRKNGAYYKHTFNFLEARQET